MAATTELGLPDVALVLGHYQRQPRGSPTDGILHGIEPLGQARSPVCKVIEDGISAILS